MISGLSVGICYGVLACCKGFARWLLDVSVCERLKHVFSVKLCNSYATTV